MKISASDINKIEEQLWKMTTAGDAAGKMYRNFRLMARLNPDWPSAILKIFDSYEKVLGMVLVQQDSLEVELAQELSKARADLD